MQTVNFQCGHCGNLMAVGINFLGQQVRCPHCQQVVMAPASAAPAMAPASVPAPVPAAPTPAFLQPPLNFTQHNEDDSIFAPPASSEDVFGVPSAPRLELPPPTTPPPPAPVMLEPAPAAPPVLDTTMAFVPSEPVPDARGGDATTLLVDGASQQPASAPANDSTLLTPDQFSGVAIPTVPRTPRVQTASRGASLWWLYCLVLPLLSYAILATVLIIMLWNKSANAPPDPLERLPDVDGDAPGARPAAGGGQKASWAAPEQYNNIAIAPSRQVGLGETLRIGDLEVTPQKVELKTVKVWVETAANPEPCQNPSLVLSLRLRNVSDQWAFTPLDNYFDRKPKPGSPKPLTVLEAGSKKFYGGPAPWYPRNRPAKNRQDRQWVDGRKNFDDKGLAPGLAEDTIICTDGDGDNFAGVVDDHQNFLWRVHLRRGVVKVGKGLKPATTVIGVHFTKKQIAIIDR